MGGEDANSTMTHTCVSELPLQNVSGSPIAYLENHSNIVYTPAAIPLQTVPEQTQLSLQSVHPSVNTALNCLDNLKIEPQTEIDIQQNYNM